MTETDYTIPCFSDICEGEAPFIRENKKGDCTHKCKTCGLKFVITAYGDVKVL